MQSMYVRMIPQFNYENVARIVIVGEGRVGKALLQMNGRCKTTILKRNEKLPVENTKNVPIIVATHNCDLESVLQQVPASRWHDLVFLQGGMLLPWLQEKRLLDTTQVLLYMSALQATDSDEVKVVDGCQTVVTGRWAHSICHLLESGQVKCTAVSKREFYVKMIDKLLWTSIFWLLCEAHGGISVGEVTLHHQQDVADLVEELYPVAKQFVDSISRQSVVESNQRLVLESEEHHGIGLSNFDGVEVSCDGVVDRLCEYSLAISNAVPNVSMALREFQWRNGWFLKQKETPLHLQWLNKLSFDLKEHVQ